MKAVIYTRVSTADQTAAQQEAACRKYAELRGWDVAAVIEETASSGKARPKKEALAASLGRGEYGALIVFRLDRWARSLREFVLELEDLLERGVVIASVTETVDTSTAMGKAMFQLSGLFAELERGLLREATAARLQALKNMGKTLGRPRKAAGDLEAQVIALRTDGEGMSLRAIARAVGLSETTVRRVMQRRVPSLTEAGLSPSEISRGTGLEEAAVRRALAKAGIAPREVPPQSPPRKEGSARAQASPSPQAPFVALGVGETLPRAEKA